MQNMDNLDQLENQLADLQMAKDSCTSKAKKMPPAVPPKKKPQPQVPHSALVSGVREPSYSCKISPIGSSYTTPTYSNISKSNIPNMGKDYVNINDINKTQAHYLLNQPASNVSTYSNIPSYTRQDKSCTPSFSDANGLSKGYDNNQNNMEYLPPPSPVSSNYSELVRATTNINYNQNQSNYPPIYQNEFPEYGISQGSTYESIYEPINPRPQNENLPNYSDYSNNTKFTTKSPLPKEEEVDALTNLLIKSISDSQDLDIFGTCVKCHDKVIGESSGCKAMGNIYHITCFCCHSCNINLQGKPFYAVEGQPYCETDYYEILEKCSVCDKPILDRILRATGKPYHPTCFTCVVCHKSLDGIPFTVDAMNQIHCIEDFHRKFAPRCCVCELPIMPEEGEEETVRVVALDRSFHVRCYCCEDCGLLLSSEAEGRSCYPLDGHILCMNCNAQRIRQLTNVMTTDL